ncbi:MAG: LysR substrate-binding domain-containing protein [Povalibacter sp.]|jgi:DNA-binding transcriptional LysR family regulator
MSRVQSNWFVRSRLKTRQIVLLLHLDEKRSVVRAAKAAGMTQPAASRLLSEMEQAIGVKLFERHARGMEPTWYGEILIKHARAALAEMDRAHEQILALKAGWTGQASIGTVMNPGVYLVPATLAILKKSHPGICVSVEMNHSKPLVSRLIQGDLDMVVGRVLDTTSARDLDFEPLAEEPHSFFVRAGHPLASRPNLRFQDISEEPWILPPAESLLRPRVNALFHEHGLPLPKNIIETSDLPIIIELLRATNALTPMTKESAQPYVAAGLLQVLPINLEIRMDMFGIITRRHQVLGPGADVLLKLLRETALKLYPPRGRAKSRTA